MNDLTQAKKEGVKAYCSNCQHRADLEPDVCDCQKCKDEVARLVAIRDQEQESEQQG